MNRKKITLEEYCKDNNMEHLLNEWNYEKNKELGYTPQNITYGSSKKICWICDKGHEWKTVVSDRTKGKNCPYCSNQKILKGYNDLETTHPHIAKEWHPTLNNNLKPSQVSSGSGKKVWWKCNYCNKDYERRIDNKIKLQKCPCCKTKYENNKED